MAAHSGTVGEPDSGREEEERAVDIELAPQRIFALKDALSAEEVRTRAMDRRATAISSGIGGLLQRPKADDITLLASQRRVEPFWHVAGKARYVYDRTREYSVPPSGPEVKSVEFGGTSYDVVAGKAGRGFKIEVREHCREDIEDELFVDALTGEPSADGAAIRTGPTQEVDAPAALATDGTIVLAPEHRASFVVRQLLGRMLKPVQADTVLEEVLTLDASDLYYRPIWAFEFHWAPKDKTGVLEIDAITGQVRQAASLTSHMTKLISRDALFDIGADTIGLLVPGGGLAVKVARAAIDRNY
jgi:hypothetical protein